THSLTHLLIGFLCLSLSLSLTLTTHTHTHTPHTHWHSDCELLGYLRACNRGNGLSKTSLKAVYVFCLKTSPVNNLPAVLNHTHKCDDGTPSGQAVTHS